MGAPLPVGTAVTEEDLPSYVAGLVVTNDVSARDVQLTKGQFYESKSYPTFTPTGPTSPCWSRGTSLTSWICG
jgi:2-keto-4-pentenoate hydratase/2-oxohepta-3-ene-1,7-dioic acid hydratase in catechol pathway